MKKIFTILSALFFIGASAIAATTIVSNQAELEAAIAKSTTITLGASFTLTSTIHFNVNKTYTLDLHGYSITSLVTDDPAILITTGNVTITDSGTGGTISGNTDYPAPMGGVAVFVDGGKLTVDGGKFVGGGFNPYFPTSGLAILQRDGRVILSAGIFVSRGNWQPALQGVFTLATGSTAKGYSDREMKTNEKNISSLKDLTRYLVVVVTPSSTGLNSPSRDENTIVFVRDNRVNIIHAIGQSVAIYSTTGKKLYELRCTSDNEIITLPGRGIYIVRVGNYAQKVLAN